MRSVNKVNLIMIIATVFCHNSVFAEVLIDPTRPPTHQAMQNKSSGIKGATGSRWVLSSTLIAPARRLATINGKTVTIGQMIGTAKVVSIEPTQVALIDGNKHIVLSLLPTGIKRVITQ